MLFLRQFPKKSILFTPMKDYIDMLDEEIMERLNDE